MLCLLGHCSTGVAICCFAAGARSAILPSMFDSSWYDFEKWWLPCLVFVALTAVLHGVVSRLRRHRRSRIAKSALGAERAAMDLLCRHGYQVLETQVRQVWPVLHGATQVHINLRADALVRRGNRRYIAEVKSSSLVADLKHGPTRRQLLEYAIAYAVDGVLLIDMHAEHIEQVTFPGLAPTRERKWWPLVTACSVAFVVGAWFGLLDWV